MGYSLPDAIAPPFQNLRACPVSGLDVRSKSGAYCPKEAGCPSKGNPNHRYYTLFRWHGGCSNSPRNIAWVSIWQRRSRDSMSRPAMGHIAPKRQDAPANGIQTTGIALSVGRWLLEKPPGKSLGKAWSCCHRTRTVPATSALSRGSKKGARNVSSGLPTKATHPGRSRVALTSARGYHPRREF